MPWPDDLTADLPRPRSDEPESLRQDIADELADHLQCALARELCNTPDAGQAKARVLLRFGDPLKVARKLWFDALRERIMAQRILVGASVFTSMVCLVLCGLLWRSAEASRERDRAVQEYIASVQAQMAQQAGALERALAAAKPAAPPANPEWNPLKLQLVLDKSGGPPAAGFQIDLRGQNATLYDGTCPSDGIADCGLARPGNYVLTVAAPWGEVMSREVIVRAGMAHHEEIVCPSAELAPGDVAVSVDWPADLRGKGLSLLCQFKPKRARVLAAQSWQFDPPYPDGLSVWLEEQITPPGDDGKATALPLEKAPRPGMYLMEGVQWFPHSDRVYFPKSSFDARRPAPPFRLMGEYTLGDLLVISGTADGLPGTPPINVHTGFGLGLSFKLLAVVGSPFPSIGGIQTQLTSIPTPRGQYDAQPGQFSEWKIELPDRVWGEVRKNLAAGPAKEETHAKDTPPTQTR